MTDQVGAPGTTFSRRQFVKATGTAGAFGLAGCVAPKAQEEPQPTGTAAQQTASNLPRSGKPQVVDVTEQNNQVTLRAVTSSLPVHPGDSMGGAPDAAPRRRLAGARLTGRYGSHPLRQQRLHEPPHTHNHRFRVVEKDGSQVPDAAQYEQDILDLAPAERKTVEFEADADPGIYLMHCHKVSHAMNGNTYPGGMVGGIVYESVMDSDICAQLMEYAGYDG